MKEITIANRHFIGTLSERDAIESSHLEPGDTFTVVGGSRYSWDDNDWFQTDTAGAKHNVNQNEPFPERQFFQLDCLAGTADEDVLYTEGGDFSMYNTFGVENNSSVAVDLFISSTSTINASQPAVAMELTDDVYDGETTAEAVQHNPSRSIIIPGNKTGWIPRKMKIQTAEIRQAAAGTPAAGEVKFIVGIT